MTGVGPVVWRKRPAVTMNLFRQTRHWERLIEKLKPEHVKSHFSIEVEGLGVLRGAEVH